ncbi:AMP-binding protein, partial [Burkholderia pseudomallei]|uniref:AMP-binding protein n=1 Tax=Burkholderia pseudomallei TaxID=28450 RepID=UPI0021F7C413|nr:AMP-binding protein [Burkholderia pseudomallei]
FLQYTSGSTSRPKGAAVRHRNLVANERMIAQPTSLDHASTSVAWMPHYHDLGLIGGLLPPPSRVPPPLAMPPSTFLTRPLPLPPCAPPSAPHPAGGGPDVAAALAPPAGGVVGCRLEDGAARRWLRGRPVRPSFIPNFHSPRITSRLH